MYFLHAINSDRQTGLLNVLGQIAMILGDKKNSMCIHLIFNVQRASFILSTNTAALSHANRASAGTLRDNFRVQCQD